MLALECRLYTGIHAKPKPKFKTGAISESTTALNVDQSNTSAVNADQKITVGGAALPLPSQIPSVLVPLTVTARGLGQDQPAIVASAVETRVGGTAASTVASSTTLKKEAGLTKAQAEKKKIDARKKSLKRL